MQRPKMIPHKILQNNLSPRYIYNYTKTAVLIWIQKPGIWKISLYTFAYKFNSIDPNKQLYNGGKMSIIEIGNDVKLRLFPNK